MKTNSTRFLLLFIILTVFFSLSCKKHLFDYRNKYLGTWNFSYEKVDLNTSVFPPRNDTVRGEYTGTISYKRRDDRNTITIDWSPGYRLQYHMDKDGNFNDCAVKGKFEGSDHVDFSWVTKMACGGGHGSESYKVSGVKE